MPGIRVCALLALAALLEVGLGAAAPPELVGALTRGGYVLVIRHVHAPAEPPARPDPANRRGERELDAAGRAQAEAVGRGLRAWSVPVGPVYSSPAFRALQTVQAAGLPAADVRSELGDGGASMAPTAAGAAGTAWLRARAAQAPPPGQDAVVVTHGPNIVLAFGEALNLADGEAAVFRPDGRGGAELVGRIRPQDWPVP